MANKDEQDKRAWYDLRQTAQNGKMTMGEKNFYQKHIAFLWQMGYYRDNQSIYAGGESVA